MRPLSAPCSFVLHVSLVAALCFAGAGCSNKMSGKGAAKLDDPVMPKPEMRAIFVASAWNIDWPSQRNRDRRQQMAEMHSIIARAREMNCNVIMLEVRSFGDRMHRETMPTSQPWASALNHGHDPDPKKQYDPLAEWVVACHAKGIELHAWIQPFRVDKLVGTLPVIQTEDGHHLYLDPTSKRVQDYLVNTVIADLLNFKVHRKARDEHSDEEYDDEPPSMMMSEDATTEPSEDDGPDGIIIDHCFNFIHHPPFGDAEPQPSVNKPPTKRIKWLLKKSASYPHGPDVTLDDFMKASFKKVYSDGNRKFGVSPYAESADAKRWLEEGIVNYIVPQLYLKRGETKGSKNQFRSTLEDWIDRIPGNLDYQPIVVPALYTTRAHAPGPGEPDPWPALELKNQVDDARAARGDKPYKMAQGQALYSWGALRSSAHGGPRDNIGDQLRDEKYNQPALVPVCVDSPAPKPKQPTVTLDDASAPNRAASWQPGENIRIRRWAVWFHANNKWGPMKVFGPGVQKVKVNSDVDGVRVKLIDQYNSESDFGRN